MTDDQIERVAVALCELDGMNPYYESEPGYFYWHDYVKPAQAAIEAMQGWWPIEDGAPKDGAPILVTYNFEDYTVVSWNKYGAYWNLTESGLNAEDGEFYPTHWQPIQIPPKKG